MIQDKAQPAENTRVLIQYYHAELDDPGVSLPASRDAINIALQQYLCDFSQRLTQNAPVQFTPFFITESPQCSKLFP